MKKYKLLKFGRCYINQKGDFVIGLMSGKKKYGYYLVGSHANTSVFLGHFWLESRIVPNDGNWIEVHPKMFNVASALHMTGHVMEVRPNISGRVFWPDNLPTISKKY
jgi:hypothetical protein